MKIAKNIISIIESEFDLEALADYLSNGLENDSESDAIDYLKDEFGIDKNKAKKVIDGWQSKFARKPIHKTEEVTKWLNTIL